MYEKKCLFPSIGDSLLYHSDHPFSTKDLSSLGLSCAKNHKGAWWYNHCLQSNLNGFNYQAKFIANGKGIVWETWRGLTHSLLATQLAIYPKSE